MPWFVSVAEPCATSISTNERPMLWAVDGTPDTIRIRIGYEDGDAEVVGVDSSSTVLIRGFVACNSMEEPVLSGKIMYLSQYAVINATVSVESTSLGNSLVDAPGGLIGGYHEAECVPNLTPNGMPTEPKTGRSKDV